MYYTRRYSRTSNIRFDEQITYSLPSKRLSIPACDQPRKSTAVVVLSSLSGESTNAIHHHHVIPSCDISKTTPRPLSNDSTLPIENASPAAHRTIQGDDQTPLLTSELASTIKNSSNRTTRKYSLNALLPLVRPSNSHPFCSSLTKTGTTTTATIAGGKSNAVDLKSRRRVSLSSALRRHSFAKPPQTFASTIDSTVTTTSQRTVSPPPSLPTDDFSVAPIDSDSSDRASLITSKSITSNKNPSRRKSSSLIPGSYRKDFMQKIERFRYIDDSASSTTTITSPVESIERANASFQPCSHLITSAIEQFDDYVRAQYPQDTHEDINSLIDRLDSEMIINGSYSDLNILNQSSITRERPQSFKPVNDRSFQPTRTLADYQRKEHRPAIHSSAPINIPHSITSLPLSSQHHRQRQQIDSMKIGNGHSRSMDFQSLMNTRDLIRPVALVPIMAETSSSSSTATLTSLRSSTSIEFDDNTKPSGVLVDDDFLPMSSPVDDHFWNMNSRHQSHSRPNNRDSFPNVGSSPDLEVKRFDLQHIYTLSETSCDDEDDDGGSSSVASRAKTTFSRPDFKVKDSPKAPLLTKTSPPLRIVSQPAASSLIPSNNESEQSIPSTTNKPLSISVNPSSVDQVAFVSPVSTHSDFLGETNISSECPAASDSDDDTQDSSANELSEGEDSADNGEIDLAQEFELSQKDEEQLASDHLWTSDDRDVFIVQEDDLLSAVVATSSMNQRSQPTSIMKLNTNKSMDSIHDPPTTGSLKPKVRFNLDPQYEREREWNKVNKLLGNSVEWTDEFEV